MTIASFDVFDTTLTRQTASPHSVFLLLGERLRREGQIACSPESFARQRIEAEAVTRRYAPAGEPTGDVIYRTLHRSFDTCLNAEQLWRAEKDLERSLIRPVPATLARIVEERHAGTPVVFTSDTYFDSGFVESLLREHGAFKDGDRVFVSCELSCSKRQGTMFPAVAQRCGVSAAQIRHFGNDAWSDGDRARSTGVRATLCHDCDLTRYESIADRHAFATSGATSLLAGAARLARLQLTQEGRYDPALHEAAAGVAAPVLVAYIAWLLVQAHREGLDALFFVSRDGQVMLEVAKRLAPRLGVTCDLRYLYGSRQAWHLAGLTSITQHDLSWILERRGKLSADMVLRRLHLPTCDYIDEFRTAGARFHDPDADLSHDDVQSFAKALTTSGRLAEIVISHASQKRQLLHAYLSQQGIGDLPRWGLVDIGWRGRLQGSLERALRMSHCSLPIGFYLGLDRDADGLSGKDMRAFLFDTPARDGWGRMPDAVAFVTEMFCQATHGMVTGYEKMEEVVSPTINDGPTAERLAWGVAQTHEGILACVDNVPDAFFDTLACVDLRPMACELIEEFWHRPSSSEATRWGTFPYEDDQSGAFHTPLSRPVRFVDVAMFLICGRSPYPDLSWPAASRAASSPFVRAALKAARLVRRMGAILHSRLYKTLRGFHLVANG